MKKVQTSQGMWVGLKLTTLLLLLVTQTISAQTVYKLNPGKGTVLNVSGTSNVHGWTMTSTLAQSQGVFRLNAKGEIVNLSNFNLSAAAKYGAVYRKPAYKFLRF